MWTLKCHDHEVKTNYFILLIMFSKYFAFSFIILWVTIGEFIYTQHISDLLHYYCIPNTALMSHSNTRNTSDVRHNLMSIKYLLNSLKYKFLSLYFILLVIHFCFNLRKYFCTISLVLTWKLQNRQVNDTTRECQDIFYDLLLNKCCAKVIIFLAKINLIIQ